MEQRLLPLWTSNKCTTYSEVQVFCALQYKTKGPALCEQVSKHIDSLATSEDYQSLHSLNDLSIKLSCFNPLWSDFSLAVFESILFPKSRSWTSTYLRNIFDDTIRRIENGTS